ncbi:MULTISPECIES: NADP-dependent oxidoreductase [Paenibacillus]|uniref:Alcohol dehydrogenase zinc-binding domain protein n=2 Tax=Paenibacillus lactis TaxID=228574 RepID=G4HGI2_9BACL|nr:MULTISPECIES: NADP-dependent oxidoreductase [Paenibacillus]EHB63855.1 Alcohol dehydrogenase zinc-binding domain protein [Paenibacillus lactis 154]MBP1894875.1 NADPH:quinone reductase-like Zn-dependent oxidoreductase [Paenibacillus lactis]HAF96888.1 NADP-dependent oxidoreductase [Paenibacillus lactis]
MKAMAVSTFGPPEVLTLMEMENPSAGPGTVRVRVKAAGVMPFDCRVREGTISYVRNKPLPIIPGNEFAGVIDQVGEGVEGFEAGMEVLGFSLFNSYAEYIVVSADQIVTKPPYMPWDIAGGLSGNGQGAHMALKAIGIGHGDTVIIHGAAGGFGTWACQLAKRWGAKVVIGTASEANHDYLRSLGVIPVHYGEGLVKRVRAIAPQGVDAALDAAGAEALRASVELVPDKKRIRTMVASETADELGVPALEGMRSAARLQELTDLYEEGAVRIHLRQTYPLALAQEAHRLVETGHGRGKVVLTL